MFRPAAFMGIVLVIVLAFGVFQVEHRVQTLRAELDEINRQIIADRDAIHVLKAEWSYLNNPSRLRDMSDEHLFLKYVEASQVRDVGDIPLRPLAVSGHIKTNRVSLQR